MEQQALIIPANGVAEDLFGTAIQVAGRATQARTYYESLKYWAEFTVAWLYHSSRITSDRSRERYLDVLLDFFGSGGKFEALPFETDREKFERIATVLDASPIKPWEVDARAASAYKIALENRTFVAGKAERRGKRGQMLQKSTKAERHLSSKSIANAMAIMSSFYKRASAYSIYKHDVEAMLYERANPFDAVDRPQFKIMFARKAMTEDEVNRVLAAIPANTLHGAMHFALLTTYAETGRRNTEIRKLKFGDFEVRGDGTVWYRWHGKHHQEGETSQIAPVVWQAIEDYLRAAGRLEGMQANDYIFVALSNRAARLKGNADWKPGQAPLSMTEVNRILKTYLRKAGIKHDYVIHSFRHTLARRLLDEGAGIEEVKETLGHSDIGTTLIYTEEKEHALPEAMGRYEDKIGIHRLIENRKRIM